MKTNIKNRFLGATLLPLLLLGVTCILLIIIKFYEFAENTTIEETKEYATVISDALDILYQGNYGIKDNALCKGDTEAIAIEMLDEKNDKC